jgi:hypothetical protein
MIIALRRTRAQTNLFEPSNAVTTAKLSFDSSEEEDIKFDMSAPDSIKIIKPYNDRDYANSGHTNGLRTINETMGRLQITDPPSLTHAPTADSKKIIRK